MSKDNLKILPDYLANFLKPREKQKFEEELGSNEALRIEKQHVELSIEKFAIGNALPFQKDLSDTIWNKINAIEEIKDVSKKYVFDVNKNTEKSNRFLRIAASVAFLLSLIGNLYLYSRWRTENNNFRAILAEKSNSQVELDKLRAESELMFNEVSLLKNPNIKVCKLLATNQKDKHTLLLGIDMKNDMQIMVTSPNLPQKDDSQSYQLWAVNTDGEIVCMGTFDAEKKIYKMKKLSFIPIQFGVTIEKGKDGMPQPTSDFLVKGI